MNTLRTLPTPHGASRAKHPCMDGRWLPHTGAVLLIGAGLGLGLASGAAVANEAASGTGLRTQASMATPWSARFGWSEASLDPTLASPVTARLSWQWLGDYHFAPAWGLRATGGVRGQLDLAGAPGGHGSSAMRVGWAQPAAGVAGNDGNWTSPYLGLGYDTSASLRNGWGGWGLSADLGLLTRRPSGLRLGSNGEAEEGWRSMRLTPVLQVGVSYSF